MQDWSPEVHTAIAKQVRFEVARIRQRFHYLDRSEAEGAAWVAAVQAMATHDPAGTANVRTWTGIRIAGALLDMAMLHVKRSQKHAAYIERLSATEDSREKLNAHRDALHILANAPLTPRERELVRLFYLEELTLMEVGERVGLCYSYVWVAMQRALGIMRRFAESDKTHGLGALRATLTPCPGRKKSRQFCPTL